MATAIKEKNEVILLPEMRLINHSLFERDAYQNPNGGAPGKPMYKVELAGSPNDLEGEGTIEDKLADAIAKRFGDAAAQEFLDDRAKEGKYINPLLDGNRLAKARADKGKEGDAYKGKIVIRASTLFNRDGAEGPGGAKVYGPATEVIGIVEGNAGDIYNGCYGIPAVTIHTYAPEPGARGEKGVKFRLTAFQKTRDGERLKAADNTASMFKPVSGAASSGTSDGVRRRRAG